MYLISSVHACVYNLLITFSLPSYTFPAASSLILTTVLVIMTLLSLFLMQIALFWNVIATVVGTGAYISVGVLVSIQLCSGEDVSITPLY